MANIFVLTLLLKIYLIFIVTGFNYFGTNFLINSRKNIKKEIN